MGKASRHAGTVRQGLNGPNIKAAHFQLGCMRPRYSAVALPLLSRSLRQLRIPFKEAGTILNRQGNINRKASG
jgi:hypothetical protein